ncbi:MAG: hypothetical protein QE283_06380 [Rhodoferax sp.]|nr:hypothetical protein [Rhodoferax sp.]
MKDTHPTAASGMALFDERPFFEKALAYGLQHGLIDEDKLATIRADGPKGMVQIARYFGSEFLRPELEKAKERLVNLVSLNLQHASHGDLQVAAQTLRENSLLSRSKGGSDMLKALIVMPQNTHFGMADARSFSDEHIPLLERWSLKSYADYQAEYAKRKHAADVVDAAIWCAAQYDLDVDALQDEGKDAEAVVRTALLLGLSKRTDLPDWPAFNQLIAALRKKYANSGGLPPLVLPKGLPELWQPAVEALRQSVLADWPRIMDATATPKKLFDQTPAFLGRYFWLEDGLAELEDYERSVSATWAKTTGGHEDEGSLLTLLLCVAAGSAPKTVLTEKAASTLVRKIRKSGLDSDAAVAFVRTHAPAQFQADYLAMWESFLEDALPTLRSDADYALHDALALLRRECNVAA